jgi:class 3 adenylate cyclase
VLTTVFDWIVYLQGIAPPEVNGLVVVLVDSYGRAGTFQVDGLNATFLGTGDLYNPKYAGMVYTAPLACSQSSLSGTTTVLPRILQTENGSVTPSSGEEHQPTSCPYTLYIYPSDELEAIYASGDLPAVYVTVVVMIVVGTSLAFLLFDKYTKRKDELLMAKAERAHAIVASLFPETVQDRLMAGKAGLKSYLQDGDDYRADAFDPETKPIADLWPNTTISFCDCVGFTAWSSTREPAQIFLLLETLFSAFDEIARKHGVFKVSGRGANSGTRVSCDARVDVTVANAFVSFFQVESVGDCYVAVCGLPDPREDHAVVMARYARDCQRRVRELLHQLEVTLGPDTSELSIRFGLHSGKQRWIQTCLSEKQNGLF